MLRRSIFFGGPLQLPSLQVMLQCSMDMWRALAGWSGSARFKRPVYDCLHLGAEASAFGS